MSAHASVTEPRTAGPDPFFLLRWVDVVLVIAAAPLVVLADLPVLGYVVGAATWIVSRLLANAIEHWAKRQGSLNRLVGIQLFSSMGRALAVGTSILAVGLAGEREDGATAAILVLVAFTVFLGTTLLIRMLERSSSR